MTNEELFEWCCKQNCKGDFNCDLCMYEKGRKDAIDELKSKADCDLCYECAMADANLNCMLGLKEQK